jgi:hypothetical protein
MFEEELETEELEEEVEEEKEYTPEELGIDIEFNYFDDNKDELYYERRGEE